MVTTDGTTAASVRPQISALVSDVDGTLVTSDKVLTRRACAAVAALRVRGIAFSIISSRPLRGMGMLIEPLGITAPIAGFNGGVIATAQETVVEQHLLAADVARQAVDFLTARVPEIWVFDGDAWLLRDRGPHTDREIHTVKFEPAVVADFPTPLDGVGKIVAASEDHALLRRCEAGLAALLGHRASVARSQLYYLDVTHPLANKGAGVRALATRMRVPMAEVAVIGDGANDVAMFEQAAFRIAMGNGVPELRERADVVTKSNDEDGFAEAIERYVLDDAK